MKYAFGILAGLLFAATMVMAEPQNLPFPQGANPALQSGSIVPLVNPAYKSAMPSAMAANAGESFQDRADFYLSWRTPAQISTGSPFPAAANPSRDRGSEVAPGHGLNGGSPFPSAANPASLER